MAKPKKSKNQLRREKLKSKKSEVEEGKTPKREEQTTIVPKQEIIEQPSIKQLDTDKLINRETTASNGKIFESELDSLLENEQFAQFRHVFDRFHTEEPILESTTKGDIMDDEDEDNFLKDSEDEEESNNEPQISKKKLRKQQKIPLSDLKTYSKRPELVQWYDVDAADPKLVVELKTHKNFVPVPIHWQFKREYLSGRRGFEKKAFTLPKYISETGITDMRDTTKDDDKSLKQISREKVQPKMNRLDMDYQRLYDAFFKFQTRPRLYAYGEVYFEGKEVEDHVDYTQYKPGIISDELRNALGIPNGVTAPWVIKMQAVGPPPSYPGLKIPGFNTALEDGDIGSFEGYQAPLHGDIESEPFGKLLEYESSENEEEEEDEEEGEEEVEELEEEEDGPVVLQPEEILKYQQAEQTVPETEAEPVYEQEPPSDEEDVPLAEIEVAKEEADIAPKKLYEILKQKVSADAGFLSSGLVYEVPTGNKRKSDEISNDSKRTKTETTVAQVKDNDDGDEDEDEDEDEVEGGKFKF